MKHAILGLGIDLGYVVCTLNDLIDFLLSAEEHLSHPDYLLVLLILKVILLL